MLATLLCCVCNMCSSEKSLIYVAIIVIIAIVCNQLSCQDLNLQPYTVPLRQNPSLLIFSVSTTLQYAFLIQRFRLETASYCK